MRTPLSIIAAAGSALALAACGGQADETATTNDAALEAGADNAVIADNGSVVGSHEGAARAMVATADGKPRGEATVTDAAQGLRLTYAAQGMEPGTYGVHLHTTGKCEGPKFESAGGHWNPMGKQHGRDNPLGAHMGDLPNLTVGADGTGTVEFTIPGATVAGGADGLLDADGAAFMVHAKPDDYKTDPSGSSGDRIACGVFAAS